MVVPVSDKTIITSALPYIHGVPHLGNIVGSLLPADIYHRYLDIVGEENIFICGSDEHGTPLELAALEAGVPVEEYADQQHETVKSVLEDFNLDFTEYGRTDTPFNEKQTHEMFKNLYKNGYITEKAQQMPHCANCDRFLPDRYIEGECPHCGGLARGDQCDEQGCGKLIEPEELIDPYCTICGESDISFRETKNLYLQLSLFEDELKAWVKDTAPIPDNVKSEVLNLIDEGLEDRCITRDIDWGFSVPTADFDDLDDDRYEDKVLYVWFDAPIGYIGITRQYLAAQGDESQWEQYWKHEDADTVYSIGKDNTIFHTVIWPAILLGQQEGYNLPDYEFIQQYLLSDDVQFSKSRGTGLSSSEALDLLPPDYWRFYLAAVMPINHDTSFGWDDFETRINADLNDTIGNYVNRVLSLTDKWFDGTVPEPSDQRRDACHTFLHGDDGVFDLLEQYQTTIEDERNLKKGLEKAVRIAHRGDEFLSDQEPWNNEHRREDVIYSCLQSLKALALALYPYTPDASEQLWGMLHDGANLSFGDDHIAALRRKETFLSPGASLGKTEILFEKVDAEDLAAAVEETDDATDDNEDDTMETISFEDFDAVDLRTATIKEVTDHPNADKLYVLQIDVGGDVKQSCAGLKPYKSPEELEDKQVIVVNNMEPTELRGKTSECMLLAVEDADDVVVLEPERNVSDGLEVH
ncbi:MAG: methionine--tRNA ligase [Candidatus Nanohaloarchaeota archaeon QJJ-5]|nr:methionine--tRNA ligase [Candidatus Nanohaloarchaeota archaeon QJJ-5]